MRTTLLLLASLACGDPAPADDETPGGTTGVDFTLDGTDGGADGSAGADGSDGSDGSDGTSVVGSAGCGQASPYAEGGVQVELDAGSAGDGLRGFYLVVPRGYDPNVPHEIVLGYPGTNWVGEQIRGYLRLEGREQAPTVFAYPDPLWRDFPGWGNYGGWVLGPHGGPAVGNGDLVFTDLLLDRLADDLCLDESQVFVTGHSWGGDMAHVVACFLGDRVTAAAPAAANTPYWFRAGSGWADCAGQPAVWTFHGLADEYFGDGGAYGLEVTNAWLANRSCDSSYSALATDPSGDCRDYGCDPDLRLCLYEPSAGHGIPSYFPQTAMDWFSTQ